MVKQFYLRVQHGIQGGFVAPTPSAIHEIKCTADTGVTIATHVRADGPPRQLKVDTATHGGTVDALLAELERILASIPPSDNRGADTYGIDVGLFFGTDQLEWRNGAFEGCGAPDDDDDGAPTAEQKDKFKRAVEISEELVALGVAEGN